MRWLAFAVVLDFRCVGVSSVMRTYERPVVVRVVTGHAGMPCDWGKLPYEVMEKISSRLAHEV